MGLGFLPGEIDVLWSHMWGRLQDLVNIQNPLDCTLKRARFMVCELYLNSTESLRKRPYTQIPINMFIIRLYSAASHTISMT